jgi:uncharacterized protein YdeI (YjbR/CyaY-like superfamily)
MSVEIRAGLPVIQFETCVLLEAWLQRQPGTANGAWLRLAKKDSGITSPSRAEAVDALLCHGWIDGQQDRYDAVSWLVRITPRKRASRWSEVNRTRATELIEAGRMQPAGLAKVEAAQRDGRWAAAYPPASTAAIPPDLQSALNASPSAAAAFARLKATERYRVLYRLSNLKLAPSRFRLIETFVSLIARENCP